MQLLLLFFVSFLFQDPARRHSLNLVRQPIVNINWTLFFKEKEKEVALLLLLKLVSSQSHPYIEARSNVERTAAAAAGLSCALSSSVVIVKNFAALFSSSSFSSSL